jgi:predicted O-methyltransferase YrrM
MGNMVLFSLAKNVLRAVIRKAGYDVVRVNEPRKTPRPRFDFTDLSEHCRATDPIPGMVKIDAAELLYAICVIQDVEGDVLEIGSWQGKSTSYLARGVKDSANGHLFAVDHFKGNVGKEHLYNIEGDSGALKERFERNMRSLGLHDVITLIPYPSEHAYSYLADRRLRFLFIDGDHTEAGVTRDIELFCPLVLAGGIVVFDDFDDSSPGVVSSVEQWILRQHPRLAFVRGNLLVCRI